MRRYCSKACEALESLCHARNEARREAELLKRTPGFVYSRSLYTLEQTEHSIAKRLDQLNAALLAYGNALNDAAPCIDAALTFEERCDVLNINPAQRREIDGERGFVALAFTHGLEGSAERRKEDFKDSPIFNALHRVVAEFLDTPHGKRACDEVFRGLFGGAADDNDDEDRGGAPVPRQPSPLHARCKDEEIS
ncbi:MULTISPECIES: hypothetical protein [Paraburkholderia]|uniref:Uncharacterized protein n=1 Tax=Paraburkholderia podalyriae TaxID=1938811 RepID=A0ABR7PQG1_9BURK|nr:hypothetical protein [Paraburkholderia podalyriae]MBC8748529.1 hypothetical protein [Paraburkholderia podalyriae]